MRISEHPILEPLPVKRKKVQVFVDGKKITAYQGEVIAAVLWAESIKKFRYTAKGSQPRGYFCGLGRCTDCVMTVDNVPNVRTCITQVKEGMKIETQKGLGKWKRK